MPSISELKKELRDLRKLHCPPTGKMKKTDVEKEIERLRGIEKATEYEAPAPKARAKKAKKVMKEMAVQTGEEEERPSESIAEKMARVRAGRKIVSALKKNVEVKKEKKEEAERESMAERMARVRAGKKIGEVLKKAVEAKKEKAKKEEAGKKIVSALKKVVEKKKAEKAKKEEEEAAKPKKRKLRKLSPAIAEAVEKIEEKPLEKKKQKVQGTDELDGKYIEVGGGTAGTIKIYKCILKENGVYDLDLQGDKNQYGFHPALRKSIVKDIKIVKHKTPEHLVDSFGEYTYTPYKDKEKWYPSINKILTENEAEKIEEKVKRGPTSKPFRKIRKAKEDEQK